MAKPMNNKVSRVAQSIAGGVVRLTRDDYVTEIDARGPLALIASMAGAIGNGWSARVDVTKADARFRTVLPHADAALVLASAAAHALIGHRAAEAGRPAARMAG